MSNDSADDSEAQTPRDSPAVPGAPSEDLPLSGADTWMSTDEKVLSAERVRAFEVSWGRYFDPVTPLINAIRRIGGVEALR